MNVHSWLRRLPHPVAVLVDGRRVEVGQGKRKWADAEESILALNPLRVEAIDASGTILRAVSLDRDDPTETDKKPVVESELQTFAKLLSAAYTQGANATKDAYAMAFVENTNLVSILAQRLGALEIAWQRAMTQTASLQAQLAEAASEGGDDAVLALLGPMMAGAKVAKANGAANGKAKA